MLDYGTARRPLPRKFHLAHPASMECVYRKRLADFPAGEGRHADENGYLHSLTEPAVVEVAPNGVVLLEMWYKHGVHHRADGPATIRRYEKTGNLWLREWATEGILHREDGPAVIWYDEKGKIEDEYFILYNQSLDRAQFNESMKLPMIERLFSLAKMTGEFDFFLKFIHEINPRIVEPIRASLLLAS